MRPLTGTALSALVALLLSACTTSDTRETAGGADADAACCRLTLAPIDRALRCRLPDEQVANLCTTDSVDGQVGLGTYVLCAVSPDGTMYLTGASSTSRFQGAGWTFGPTMWIPKIFPLPPLSAADDEVCQALALVSQPDAVPACAASGNEGGGDAARDASGDAARDAGRAGERCCNPAAPEVCGHRAADGTCPVCCQGDVCGFPPDLGGTCAGPVGPEPPRDAGATGDATADVSAPDAGCAATLRKACRLHSDCCPDQFCVGICSIAY